VRVERHRVGVEEGLEHILAGQGVGARSQLRVALVERLADFLRLLPGELQTQHIVLDRLAPQVVERGSVGRPRHVLAVVGPGVLAAEIEVVLEQLARESDAFVDPLQVHGEDVECRLQAL
jgi:hypothetical protein